MNKQAETQIGEILFTQEVLASRVREMALRISEDYKGLELHLVAVLKGALVFLADLARGLTVQTTIDFIVVSSYASAGSTGEVRLLKDLDEAIKNKHVLLVEDIIDNGITVNYLLKTLSLRKPASLKVCALLDKPDRRAVPVVPDYKGFEVPNKFVVGYGLDYNEAHRHLPYIAALRKEVYEKI